MNKAEGIDHIIDTACGRPVVIDAADYVRRLKARDTSGKWAEVDEEDVKDVKIYRLFFKGRYDAIAFEGCLRGATSNGTKVAILMNRVSKRKSALETFSLPQQEASNVCAALKDGAQALIVIVEVHSASVGNDRKLLHRLFRLMEQKRVLAWYAALPDRITRALGDAGIFTDLLRTTATPFKVTSGVGGSDRIGANEALMLMVQFIIAAGQVIAIQEGNRRVWRGRVEQGQWPNKGMAPLAISVNERGEPFLAEESKEVVRRLFDLLDPRGVGLTSEEEAIARIREEFPRWCNVVESGAEGGRPKSITPAAVRRLLRLTALVDGRQRVRFRDDEFDANFPALKDIVSREQFDRVQFVLADTEVKLGRRGGSPFLTCFNELTHDLGHPLPALIGESNGALAWTADGSFEMVCRSCSARASRNELSSPVLFEEAAKRVPIELVDGSIRDYAVPVFRCQACSQVTRPFSVKALRRLLAGVRRRWCPQCTNDVLRMRQTPRAEWMRAAQALCPSNVMVEAHCRCGFEALVKRRLFAPEERARLHTLPRGRHAIAEASSDASIYDFDGSGA